MLTPLYHPQFYKCIMIEYSVAGSGISVLVISARQAIRADSS